MGRRSFTPRVRGAVEHIAARRAGVEAEARRNLPGSHTVGTEPDALQGAGAIPAQI